MTSSGVDSAVEELGRLDIQSGFPQVHLQQLKFLIKFMRCLSKFEKADEDVNLSIANDTLKDALKEAGLSVGSEMADSDEEKGLDSMAHSLLKQFDKFKPQIEKICAFSLDSTKSISCSSDEIVEMVNCVVNNFMDLSTLNPAIVVSVKDQILVLAEKLNFLRILADFSAERLTDQQILKDFLDNVKDSVHDATSFALFGLLKGKDKIMTQGWGIMLSDLLLQMFLHHTPEMIIKLLKASNTSRSDKFHLGEIVVRLVSFILQVSHEVLKDYIHILKEELIIMITFLIEPGEAFETYAGDELFTLVATINEVLSFFSSTSFDKLSVDVSTILAKIDEVKAMIRKLFVPGLNSSGFSFPRTNGMGFVKFFIGRLKDLVKHHLDRIAFARLRFFMVHDELLSLEPFLQSIMESQQERDLEEFRDLRGCIINLVFQADHAVSSCLTIDNPIWHNLLQLADIVDAMKVVAIEVRNNPNLVNKQRLTSTTIDSSQVLLRKTKSSSYKDAMVGFKDETKTIIDMLRRGTKNLHVVSIVGMGGLGKTTIVKKVYDDLIHVFHKRAWCNVSQVYNRRELFFDILTDVATPNARKEYDRLTDTDLAEKLRKRLKQQKYLAILDDIWNIEAWDSIKDAFPDDRNGSRIIFTSRIDNLASQAMKNCTVYPLRPFSDAESWELLKLKLSKTQDSSLDDEHSKIGKEIARNCKGLPLTVVLVAGILPGKDIKFWKDIMSEVSKGCMNVLKLSYNHLPNNLKPCFLCIGAFPEDRVVRAKKLMSLWIGEGLIPRVDNTSSYNIAEAYLSDLINRNLLTPAERSTIGGIKSCQVHDLLREFCLAKIQEDNFLQLVDEKVVFHSSSDPRKFENYRLCINADWTKFVEAKPSGRFVRSILYVFDEARILFPCPYDMLNNFRLLNVLDLERITILYPFPEEVTLMVNLRYLVIKSISGGKLPSSIANLWNLEILIINCGGDSLELPRTFWLMKNLRRVSIGLVLVDKSLEDNECGSLEHLEIFSTPYSANGTATNELLKRLPALRQFKFIFPDPSCFIPHKFPELSSLTRLESLHLKESFFHETCDWFPTLDFPSSLRKLILERLRLPWNAISTIGKLPNLEVLKLRWSAFSGKRWNVEDDEFEALKFLELNRLDIEEWTVQDYPFPSLEQIVVYCCLELSEIPYQLGDSCPLRKIEMHDCTSKAATSVKKILERQKEMGAEVLEVVLVDCSS